MKTTAKHQSLFRRLSSAVLLPVILATLCTSASARSFIGEGSDLIMGVGAQNIAMGGAVTAYSHDIYASYWNPAGMAESQQNQLAFSRQLDASLDPLSFAGIAFTHPNLTFWGIKTVLSYAWIPRLHIKANGKYDADDFESTFTHYAMPDLPLAFDGSIESKTRDHRFTIALTPATNPKWSAGVSIGRVDCKSNFCGVFAKDPNNYTIASVGATAITLGVGAKYYATDKLTLGLNIKDLDTQLSVKTVTSDSKGTTINEFKTPFPRDITAGLAYRFNKNTILTTDFQYVKGAYATSTIDFKIIRAGFEKIRNKTAYRLGLIIPLELKTSSQDFTTDLPAPFLPTFGIGWELRWADINLAAYPNPLMSSTNNSVEMSADLTLLFKF